MNPIYDFKGRQTLWRSHLLELSGAKFPVGLTADPANMDRAEVMQWRKAECQG